MYQINKPTQPQKPQGMVTDMLLHGAHPFPPDMEATLREILALDPGFPDGQRRYSDQLAWHERLCDWEAGKNLTEGREAMQTVLDELKGHPE